MSETSAEGFDFPRPARPTRVADGEEVRSSPIVFLGGVAWLAIVLSGLLQYLGTGGTNFYYPFIGIYIPFFAIFLLRQVLRLALNPLFLMWSLTVVVPMVLYVAGETGGIYALQSLKQRIIFFSLVAGSSVILGAPDAGRILRVASMIVLAWAIPVSFFELIAGELFSTAEGRSAGLYENPNLASMAILICLLCAVDLTRQTARSLLVFSLGAAAVITTFSRAGILLAVALWSLHAFYPSSRRGGLRGPQRIIALAFVFAIGSISVIQIARRVTLSDEAAMRMQSVLTASVSDESSQTRLSLIEESLDRLQEQPLGHGLGFADGLGVRPHNTYLYVALDYGLFGAAFYIALLLVGLARSTAVGWQRGANAIALAFLLIYASFFSHYVAATTYYSVAFAALITGALIGPARLDRRSPSLRV